MTRNKWAVGTLAAPGILDEQDWDGKNALLAFAMASSCLELAKAELAEVAEVHLQLPKRLLWGRCSGTQRPLQRAQEQVHFLSAELVLLRQMTQFEPLLYTHVLHSGASGQAPDSLHMRGHLHLGHSSLHTTHLFNDCFLNLSKTALWPI